MKQAITSDQIKVDASKSLLQSIRKQNKKILILGAGISGFAVAELAARAGIQAELWDQAPRETVLNLYSDKYNRLIGQGIDFRFAGEEKLLTSDILLAVSSPGISPQSELFKICSAVKVVTELELALNLIRESSDCQQIVVTGSNGKSTTVSLIHHILEYCNKKSFLCGNIGASPMDLINKDFELNEELEFLVVEASSYQLELFESYRPDIALMLNLSENHLERHKTMQAYLAAKSNLVKNCLPEDVVIVPEPVSWLNEFIKQSKASLQYFASDKSVKINETDITFYRENLELVYRMADGNLLGKHNLHNIAASIFACVKAGIDLQEAIKAVATFRGLEHRLEKLESAQLIFNDSKATTAEASLAACRAVISGDFKRKILLMLGGQEKKNSNWHLIKDLLMQSPEKFQKIILFGASARAIADSFKNINAEIEIYSSLKFALEAIKPELKNDNILLFSPGCASFDEFKNFEDRGQVFKAFFD